MQKNPGGMLKNLAALQKRVDAIQKEIADASFDGQSAQGLVKVTVTGKGDLTNLVLDPTVLSEDAETVAALVMVAFGKANEAKEAFSKQKLGTVASGLLPFGMKVPGLG